MSEFIDKLPIFDEEIKQASILECHKKIRFRIMDL